MPPVRIRWVRGENEVAAWVICIPLTTQGMGKEILGLISGVNQLLSIIRLLLGEDGFIRFYGSNVINDAENNYEKVSSSLPSGRHCAFSTNADLRFDLRVYEWS